MKQECDIVSKILNIGHIFKYCINIVSDFGGTEQFTMASYKASLLAA